MVFIVFSEEIRSAETNTALPTETQDRGRLALRIASPSNIAAVTAGWCESSS